MHHLSTFLNFQEPISYFNSGQMYSRKYNLRDFMGVDFFYIENGLGQVVHR